MSINDSLTEIILEVGHKELTPYLMFKYAIKTETKKIQKQRVQNYNSRCFISFKS